MENTERLNRLLAQSIATFNYDSDDGTWYLAGEENGLLWESDDYEADSKAEAQADAIAYLEAYDEADEE